MATFETNVTAELQVLQSDYRTTNSQLAQAKRRGDKATVRELTRAKNRISAKLDSLKNQNKSQSSY